MKRISENISELSLGFPGEIDHLKEQLDWKSQPLYRELFLTSFESKLQHEVKRAHRFWVASRIFRFWRWLSNNLDDRRDRHLSLAKQFLVRAELRAERRILGKIGVRERLDWFWFSETYLIEGELMEEALREDDPTLFNALSSSARFQRLIGRFPKILRKTERRMDRMRESWRAHDNDRTSASVGSSAWDRWLNRRWRTRDRLQRKSERIQEKRDKVANELETIYENALVQLEADEIIAFAKSESAYHSRFTKQLAERRKPIDAELKEAADQLRREELEAEQAKEEHQRASEAELRNQAAAREKVLSDTSSALDDSEARLKAEINELERELAEVKRWRESDDQSLVDILDRINRL